MCPRVETVASTRDLPIEALPHTYAPRWLFGISVPHFGLHVFLQCLARWGILSSDVKKKELYSWSEFKDVQELLYKVSMSALL